MTTYVALQLKPATLARYGLTDLPYRIPMEDFMAIMAEGPRPMLGHAGKSRGRGLPCINRRLIDMTA